ncbi:MAG: four helix bundle protein [Verrucomicrobiota bacterium]|nr:four helix bundle protein [Verrucomicrobiota bacterium]
MGALPVPARSKSQPSKSFTDAVVWQKAHQFVLAVYRFTEVFPKHELFGLTSQLRRAAVSIPSNFAEGFKKRTKPDKLKFYNIAQGSIEECKYYLILTNDLKYGATSVLSIQLEEVARLLESYSAALRTSSDV